MSLPNSPLSTWDRWSRARHWVGYSLLPLTWSCSHWGRHVSIFSVFYYYFLIDRCFFRDCEKGHFLKHLLLYSSCLFRVLLLPDHHHFSHRCSRRSHAAEEDRVLQGKNIKQNSSSNSNFAHTSFFSVPYTYSYILCSGSDALLHSFNGIKMPLS